MVKQYPRSKASGTKSMADLRAEAVRRNPKGVRIVMPKIERLSPYLAGYLCLQDTDSLRRLFVDSDLRDKFLQPWREARLRYYGDDKKQETRVTKDSLWAFIAKPGSVSREVLDLPLARTESGLTGPKRAYICWITVMYQMIKGFPELFADAACPEEGTGLLGGCSAEDWNRAFCLLRAYWDYWYINKGSQVNKPKNIAANEAVFLNEEDYRGIRTVEDGKLTKDTFYDESHLLGPPPEGDDDDNRSTQAALAEQGQVDYEDTINRKMTKAFGNVPIQRSIRPELHPDALANTCRLIFKACKVLNPISPFVRANGYSRSLSLDRTPLMPENLEEVEIKQEDSERSEDPETSQRKLGEIRGKANAVSAWTPPYETACKSLELDPSNPILSDSSVLLHPWQATGISKVLQLEKSPISGAILADESGLGKTVTALGVVSRSAETAVQEHSRSHHSSGSPSARSGHSVKFRPTLIVAPFRAISVWKSELEKRFPNLTAKYFYGHLDSASFDEKERTLGTTSADLTEFVNGLPSEEPCTARVVVLTSYSTWRRRTLHFESIPSRSRDEVEKEQEADDGPIIYEIDDESADDQDDDEKEEYEQADGQGRSSHNHKLSSAQIKSMRSDCVELFDRIILDEAHMVKSRRTALHQSVALLNARYRLILTSTPITNKPSDIHGLICLLWRPEFAKALPKAHGVGKSRRLGVADYLQAEEFLAGYPDIGPTALQRYVHILHPDSFRILAATTNAQDKVDLSIAKDVLRPILRLVQIRRTIGEHMIVGNRSVRIAGEVPPYSMTTVELQFSLHQQAHHDAIYQAHSHGLDIPGKSDDSGGSRIQASEHRRLSHAATDLSLDDYFEKRSKVIQDLDRAQPIFEPRDHGATWDFHNRNNNFGACAYRDRQGMAYFQAGLSPKLQCLAGLLHDICLVHRRKVLVYAEWPMTQWTLEKFVLNLGFRLLSVKSNHNDSKRNTAVEDFGDPTHESQVLITSLKSLAASVNLQSTCSDIVFVDVPSNPVRVLQAVSRIHRPGQNRSQQVWILTVNHTYDQVLQARAAQKMVGQLVGQIDPRSDDWLVKTEEDESDDDGEEREQRERRAVEKTCSRLYRSVFGQRSSREGWGNVRDLKAKDRLPVEKEWIESNYGRGKGKQAIVVLTI